MWFLLSYPRLHCPNFPYVSRYHFFCRFFLSILCLSHLLCLVWLSPLPCLSSNLIRLCCLMCLICFVYPCIYLSTYLPIYPFCCWFFVFNAWRDTWYEWYERNFSQWFVSTWRFNAKLVAVLEDILMFVNFSFDFQHLCSVSYHSSR